MHYSRLNFKIALTGMLLGVAMLFQYLSQFMPLVLGLMDINLSFIFIVPIFFLADYKFGMIALLIRMILGPAIQKGYTSPEMIGHFVLFVTSFIFIHLLLLAKKLKVIKNKYAMYISIVSVVILTSLIMSLLNGVLFIPLYEWSFGNGFMWPFGNQFSNKIFAWGIENYWAVVFAIFTTGNLINLSISSFALIGILRVKKAHLAK